MRTDNHDAGEDLFGGKPTPSTERNDENPGYETTDVNVGGIVVFLTGLSAFVLIFFLFCFVMGKVINSAFLTEDGPATKWTAANSVGHSYSAGSKPTEINGVKTGKREDLANNPELQQRELQRMTNNFPTPRLDTDDGNQATADLHAREDLLLEHTSTSTRENGLLRIPIEHAMQLIAQRGLPVAGGSVASSPMFVGDDRPTITEPLTSGFARTGYELDVMEAREQKLSYGKASAAEHAQLAPATPSTTVASK